MPPKQYCSGASAALADIVAFGIQRQLQNETSTKSDAVQVSACEANIGIIDCTEAFLSLESKSILN